MPYTDAFEAEVKRRLAEIEGSPKQKGYVCPFEAEVKAHLAEKGSEDAVPDADTYEMIKTVIDNVGAELAKDTELSADAKLAEWVAILEWGVKSLPAGYERQREMFLSAIADPRHSDYHPPNSIGV